MKLELETGEAIAKARVLREKVWEDGCCCVFERHLSAPDFSGAEHAGTGIPPFGHYCFRLTGCSAEELPKISK